MTTEENVRQYFDGIADSYTERSNSWLWQWQRDRELRAVMALLGDVTGRHVLDFGCGSGFFTRAVMARGASRVTALDLSQRMIDQLPRENVTGITGNAATADLGEVFSHIVCAGLLEFVPEPVAVLANARRHAREDSVLSCLVPPDNLAARLYRRYHRNHAMNITLYSPDDFSRIAGDAGWIVQDRRSVPPFTSVYRLTAGPSA